MVQASSGLTPAADDTTLLGCEDRVLDGPDDPTLLGFQDRVLDGPASGGKGSNGRNYLDCIRGKGVRGARTMWVLSLAVILFGFIFFIHEGSLVQVSGFTSQKCEAVPRRARI